MGSIVGATCPCGYERDDIRIGGGMMTFKTRCAFPAYCQAGEHLVVVNLFDTTLSCPDGHSGAILPYDHPDVVGEQGESLVADWRSTGIVPARPNDTVVLTNGTYLCPRCKELTLRFDNQGLFD